MEEQTIVTHSIGAKLAEYQTLREFLVLVRTGRCPVEVDIPHLLDIIARMVRLKHELKGES